MPAVDSAAQRDAAFAPDEQPWRSPIAGYTLTLVAVATAFAARWAIDPWLGDHLPYVTFFVAVAVAAWLGGIGSALLATAAGFVLSWYFFVPPRWSFEVTEQAHALGLAMYLMVSLAFAGFGGALHDLQRKAVRRGELLRTTLASIGDAVLTTDAGGRITGLNPVAAALTGWTHDEALGRPFGDVFRIVNETTREPVADPVAKVLAEGVVVGLANHTVLIARDGREHAIDDSAAPIRDADGRLIGVVLVFRDIAERRAAEKRVADARAFAEAIVDAVREPLLVLDAELRVVSASRSFYRDFGVTPEHTEHRLVYELGNRQWDIPALRRLLEEVLPQNTAFDDFEVEHDFDTLGHRAIRLNARRVFREGASGALILLAIEDITERRQAEVQRRLVEERFRMMVEQVNDHAIFSTNVDGLATTWNEGVRRVLGFDQAQFIGIDITDTIFTPQDVADGVPERELHEAAVNGTAGNDRWMRRQDGSEFYAMGTTTALRSATGNLIGFVKVMRDQTERQRMEKQLRQYADDLAEADRHKNHFLAMLAHELRNPLAPIANAVRLLQRSGGNDAAAVQTAAAMMQRQTAQLQRLVDDLLDIARISRGRIELQRTRLKLRDVIEQAVEAARVPCADKDIAFDVALPAEPLWVDADATRLLQVLGNLLHNACKFTARGGKVWLTVSLDSSHAVIRVRDDGVGIAAEKLPRVFDMFMQGDTAIERANGGLGLGLTLAKSLVEKHGGSVQAFSDGPGRGSEFVVRLPLAQQAVPADAAPPAAAAPSIAGRRILVVDDNRDAAQTLALLLSLDGGQTRVAHDGHEALDVAAQMQPEVVLLDIGLPKLNGYEVAERMRQQPWGEHITLVALTGWGQEEDRRKSAQAGFDAHLVKPVDYDALLRLLAPSGGG